MQLFVPLFLLSAALSSARVLILIDDGQDGNGHPALPASSWGLQPLGQSPIIEKTAKYSCDPSIGIPRPPGPLCCSDYEVDPADKKWVKATGCIPPSTGDTHEFTCTIAGTMDGLCCKYKGDPATTCLLAEDR